MVFKLSKIVHFLQICAGKKSSKAIYLYPSERPHHAHSESSMFYRSMSNSSRNIKEEDIKKVLTQILKTQNLTKFIKFKC